MNNESTNLWPRIGLLPRDGIKFLIPNVQYIPCQYMLYNYVV